MKDLEEQNGLLYALASVALDTDYNRAYIDNDKLKFCYGKKGCMYTDLYVKFDSVWPKKREQYQFGPDGALYEGPANAEKYLEKVYGADWRTPKNEGGEDYVKLDE